LRDSGIELRQLEVGAAVVLAKSWLIGADSERTSVEGERGFGVADLDEGERVVDEGRACGGSGLAKVTEERDRGGGVAAGLEGKGESVKGLWSRS
jgi:hypothetical protein